MLDAGPEVQLFVCALMNALLLVPAWRLAARLHPHSLAWRCVDTTLLWYAGQYAAVCVPGVLGLLRIESLLATAAVIGAATWWLSTRVTSIDDVADEPTPLPARVGAAAVVLLTTAYHLNAITQYWPLPPTANDALIYHLPAAVAWLQGGSLSVYEPWYHNPANAYSPLAGSALLAWWLAPMNGDVLARFAQAPAVILIAGAAVAVCRRLGAGPLTATLVGCGLTLSRPIVSQVPMPKDDLFLLAFFAAAVAGIVGVVGVRGGPEERHPRPDAADDRMPPHPRPLPRGEGVDARAAAAVRLGAALGLLLATKYTAVYAVLPLLAVIDAPFRLLRWRWTHAMLALLVVLAIAGPWYGRNLVRFGNPVYPNQVLGLPGLFASATHPKLSSVGGLWQALVNDYFALVITPAVVLSVVWVGAVVWWVAGLRSIRPRASSSALPPPNPSLTQQDGADLVTQAAGDRAPPHPGCLPTGAGVARGVLARLLVLGPAVVIGAFWLTSPFAEGRFCLPALWLLACAVCVWPRHWQAAVAGVLFLACLGTGYVPGLLMVLLPTTATTFGVLAATTAVGWAAWRSPQARALFTVVLGFVILAAVYVGWKAGVQGYVFVTDAAESPWRGPQYYGALAEAWAFVRTRVPAGDAVALANSPYAYPLTAAVTLGSDEPASTLSRRVIYVSPDARAARLHELRPADTKLSGEVVVQTFAAQLRQHADERAWRDRLAASGAAVLFVAKADLTAGLLPGDPPELTWARGDVHAFTPLFENDAAAVFRVNR